MRSDIVPGAVFPDYELSDHTAKRRKLSDLQGQHPMILVLSRGGFCPKPPAGGSTRATPSRTRSRLLQIGHDQYRQHHRDQRMPHREWAPTGRSCPTLDARCKRIWTLLSTPMPRTTR
jgi:hypothetical protein